MKCDILTESEWLELNDHLAQSIVIEDGKLFYLVDMNIDNEDYDSVCSYDFEGWTADEYRQALHIWDAITYASGMHCGGIHTDDYYEEDDDYYPQQVLVKFLEKSKSFVNESYPLMILLLPDLRETKKLMELPEGVYVISCAKAAWD